MRLYVIDKRHMILREKIKGSYQNGVFKYKKGGILGLGAVTVPVKIDSTKAVRQPLGRFMGFLWKEWDEIVYAYYDGKEFSQIDMTGIESKTIEDRSYGDMLRDVKITELTKKAMLSKPRDTFKEALEIIFMVLILIQVIVGIWSITTLRTENAPLIMAANRTASNCETQMQIANNQTSQLITLIKESRHVNATSLIKAP